MENASNSISHARSNKHPTHRQAHTGTKRERERNLLVSYLRMVNRGFFFKFHMSKEQEISEFENVLFFERKKMSIQNKEKCLH